VIGQTHNNPGGTINHVAIGQHIAVGRNNKTGAYGHAILWHGRDNPPVIGIHRDHLCRCLSLRMRFNIDHGVAGFFHQFSKVRQFSDFWPFKG